MYQYLIDDILRKLNWVFNENATDIRQQTANLIHGEICSVIDKFIQTDPSDSETQYTCRFDRISEGYIVTNKYGSPLSPLTYHECDHYSFNHVINYNIKTGEIDQSHPKLGLALNVDSHEDILHINVYPVKMVGSDVVWNTKVFVFTTIASNGIIKKKYECYYIPRSNYGNIFITDTLIGFTVVSEL
jgi:hypothetical protein